MTKSKAGRKPSPYKLKRVSFLVPVDIEAELKAQVRPIISHMKNNLK